MCVCVCVCVCACLFISVSLLIHLFIHFSTIYTYLFIYSFIKSFSIYNQLLAELWRVQDVQDISWSGHLKKSRNIFSYLSTFQG